MGRLWPRSPGPRPPRPPGEGWAWSDARGWHDGLDRLADRYLRDELDLIDYLLAVAAYPKTDPTCGGRLPDIGATRVSERGVVSVFDGARWRLLESMTGLDFAERQRIADQARIRAEPAWIVGAAQPESIDAEQRRHVAEHEERRAWHAASERAKRRDPWARTQRDLEVLSEAAWQAERARRMAGHAEREAAGRETVQHSPRRRLNAA